jgi:hypothetical protein
VNATPPGAGEATADLSNVLPDPAVETCCSPSAPSWYTAETLIASTGHTGAPAGTGTGSPGTA